MAGSGLQWTTLRATQFHDLLLKTAQQMAKLPVIPVPAGFRFQPIDPEEVADRLVELALGTPAGLVPAMAGHGCTTWPSCSVDTCGSVTSAGRSYRQAPRQRRPRLPGWRKPGPGSGCGTPDLGGRPRKSRDLAKRECISSMIS